MDLRVMDKRGWCQLAFAQLSCNKKEGNDEKPVLDELCIGASTEKCTWAIFFL